MVAIVFNGADYKVYEQSPRVCEVTRSSVLCVIGSTKQKWYYTTPGGWKLLPVYSIPKKYIRKLKTYFLLSNQTLPDLINTQPNWSW